MTNSPPANVKIEDYQILASGIDKLDISIYLTWPNRDLLHYLDMLKEKAICINDEYYGSLITNDGSKELKFNIKPHGKEGHAWLLSNHDYALSIGDWVDIKQRPNIFVNIASEPLWRMGTKEAVNWITSFISGIGASIISVKPSRVDFCSDMLVPSEIWDQELLRYAVTRARKKDIHIVGDDFTGLSIGTGGKIGFRIYDKPQEINSKSKKYWMYDIWGISQKPENKKIIRAEFQVRREANKSFGMEYIDDLYRLENNIWAYLTQEWLKFQSNPGKHHTQRETFEWWINFQNGYKGSQGATPAIRQKAYSADEKSLIQESDGFIASLMALELEKQNNNENINVSIDDCIRHYLTKRNEYKNNLKDINENVRRKRAKYYRVR